MADTTDALAVDENLLEAMSFFGGVNNRGSVTRLGAVTAISCGRNFPLFNIAMLHQPATSNLLSHINATCTYYDSLRFGFCFWLCHDRLPSDLLKRADQVFSASGFLKLTTPPGLILRGMPLRPQERYSHIRFRNVDDAATRSTFCHLTSIIFEIPFAIALEIYGGAQGWDDDYAGWIGYHGKEPVSLAISNYQPTVAGFYSIGTLPQYRRRGFGEAALRWCLDRARTDRGINTFVLQSTAAGLSLYNKLGFREVTRFTIFKSREHRLAFAER